MGMLMVSQQKEKATMKENANRRKPLLFVLSALALAAAVAVLMLPAGEASPEQDAQASAAETTLSEQSELYQILTYTRCSHEVTRRLTAPVELYGKTLEEVSALYPDWRITEFSSAGVKMERKPDLFCPDHMVIMPDGAGFLCVYENRYGEAMALVRELEIPLSSLPAAVKEEAEEGVGFSTAEELEMWLEGAES